MSKPSTPESTVSRSDKHQKAQADATANDQKAKQIQSYWDKRIKEPFLFTLLISLTDFSGDIGSLIEPYNDAHFRVNCIYCVNSMLIFAAILPSLWSTKYIKNIRFGFMLLTTRNVYRLFDFE